MTTQEPSLASPLAPEDIRRGQYVAVLHVIDQYHSCWLDRSGTQQIHIRSWPSFRCRPLKVLDVCLPFVTAMKADGSLLTLDVRRFELAQLDHGYARRVFKRLRAKRPKPDRS